MLSRKSAVEYLFDDMNDTPAYLYGDIDWPTPMSAMTAILRQGGLNPSQGRYAITIMDCEHFKLQEYGGDLGAPVIEAGAESVERMIRDARLVSSALRNSGVEHEFEIYDENDQVVLVIKNGIEHGAQPDAFGAG